MMVGESKLKAIAGEYKLKVMAGEYKLKVTVGESKLKVMAGGLTKLKMVGMCQLKVNGDEFDNIHNTFILH
jgi:hypothetical protein